MPYVTIDHESNPYRDNVQGKANEPITVAGLLDRACQTLGVPALGHSLEEIWDRLGRGEDVPPSEYYLRGQPMFETAVNTPYSWMNNIVSVSLGKQEAMGVTYDVYQIL